MTSDNPKNDEDVETLPAKVRAQILRDKQDRGKVGEWFGSRSNAALYLTAGLAVLILIALSIAALSVPAMREDIIKAFIAVLFSAVGFIGGLLTDKKD